MTLEGKSEINPLSTLSCNPRNPNKLFTTELHKLSQVNLGNSQGIQRSVLFRLFRGSIFFSLRLSWMLDPIIVQPFFEGRVVGIKAKGLFEALDTQGGLSGMKINNPKIPPNTAVP